MTVLFLSTYLAAQDVRGSLHRRSHSELGASMVEYALLVGLIAIVAIVTVTLLGGSIEGLFNTTNNCVTSATNATVGCH